MCVQQVMVLVILVRKGVITCSRSCTVSEMSRSCTLSSRKRGREQDYLSGKSCLGQKHRGSVESFKEASIESFASMFCYYESVEEALYGIESVEEAWTGARLLVLKVVFGAKTPRKCAKCRGSVAPKSPKPRVQRAVHIAHNNSSRSSKCRGSVVPVGGRQTTCRWNFKRL